MQTDWQKRNPQEVKKMFSRVSRVYDIVNHAMCFGLDVLWRKRLVKESLKSTASKSPLILDMACGSGDVAIGIAKANQAAKILAADFCADMLKVARAKVLKAGFADRIEIAEADCRHLSFEDATFDAVTISFGFRNFENRKECLKELARVLKAGGKIAMLEVARANKIMQIPQEIFMGKFVPTIASICGGNADDYKYLAKTTLEYPRNSEIKKMFEEAGFKNVKIRVMGFGLVAITSAHK